MPELTTHSPDADVDDVLASLDRDGAAIVADVLDEPMLTRIRDEVEPWIARSRDGRDDFSGRSTTRTGALVARSAACREVVLHPLALGSAERFLGPYTDRIQLHLTQTIRIKPGQDDQPLHRDRLAWGGHVPAGIEPQLNTIWALSDFTTDNGATRVAPGSHRWPDDRRAGDDDLARATMSAGSVLVYSGSVVHGGGANRTDEPRTGMNITYCLAWLRTEENQFLSCPPHVARDLDPTLQELLGYTMGNYALGYYSEPEAGHEVNDILPPEFALGRKPRSRTTAGGLVDGA